MASNAKKLADDGHCDVSYNLSTRDVSHSGISKVQRRRKRARNKSARRKDNAQALKEGTNDVE